MIKDFDGRNVVVTGAGSGIGRETALLFAARGAHVLIVDRDAGALDVLAGTNPESFTPVVADITGDNVVGHLQNALTDRDGNLAVLVNNAGIGGGGRLDQTADEDLRRYLEVNVVALFRLARFAVEAMRRAGGGAIVNVASIFSIVGATASAAYSTSKGAVEALTRQMATDFGPENIRVNAVAPGLIETPLTAERIRNEDWRRQIFIDQAPLRRVGQPGDVARAITFLASSEAAFITGETLRVDGGWAVGRYPRRAEDLA